MTDLAYSIADQNFATTQSIGIYNFSIHLARKLAEHSGLDRLTIFSNSTVSPELGSSGKARIQEYDYALGGKLGRILWDQWGVYRRARATGHGWLLLPKGFCSFLARPRLPVAAYVHDIMVDFYRQRYPGFRSRFETLYFCRGLTATLRDSRVIFTNTEFSKGELMHLARKLGVPEPRIVVAGYGFEGPQAVRGEKEDRILVLASALPHKRTDIALRFLTHWLQESKYSGMIDCIGILSNGMARVEGPNWNWVGRVPPTQGREMMRRARVVVYVSEYEGFGMPPVEAVLEGTCPVFSDIPPMREAMGDAGYPFANGSEESFCQAMNQALATPAGAIEKWSKDLLKRHSWGAVTHKIVQELRKT